MLFRSATEARECRTREALTAIRMLDPSNHHERRTTFENAWNIADAALAASGPCPHAAEVERLTATNHEIAGTLTEIVIERNALRGELAEARKLCGEVALSIEANSHYTQDEDLRTVLHDASIRLRATAKGRER